MGILAGCLFLDQWFSRWSRPYQRRDETVLAIMPTYSVPFLLSLSHKHRAEFFRGFIRCDLVKDKVQRQV